MGTFLRHEPCPECGSKDNVAVYDNDGRLRKDCHGCGWSDSGPSHGEQGVIYKALPHRGIHEATCRKWLYCSRPDEYGIDYETATYCSKSGEPVAWKRRLPGKMFSWSGDKPSATLFGQQLWNNGGKRLVITEGELDAMSYSQIVDHRWPVVSIPDGAAGAVKAIKKQLEWVESFQDIVLMFDNDAAGRQAAAAVAELLTPGKARIATLPLKDANECLLAGRGRDVVDAMWTARQYRPDGIVWGAEVLQHIFDAAVSPAYPTPWEGLNRALHGGLRKSELFVLGAGTGQGKSSVCRELAYGLQHQGLKIGYIALEEKVGRSALALCSISCDRPLHLSAGPVDQDEIKQLWEPMQDRIFLYDHFGSMEVDNLLAKIRFLVAGMGVDFVILDHLSIVVSGLGINDERKAIDVAMTKLRQLVEETGCGMILVTHLSRPGGNDKPHEEGGRVRLAHLRGSHSIGQLADVAVGLERDQQDTDVMSVTTVRVVKPHRLSGFSGVAAELRYVQETGRLVETKSEDLL